MQAEGPAVADIARALDRKAKEQKKADVNTALIIIFSVLIFILSFATASSWILSAQQIIQKQPQWKMFLYFSAGLTVLTLCAALAFGFGTRNMSTHIPVDSTSLLNNLKLDMGQHGSNPKPYKTSMFDMSADVPVEGLDLNQYPDSFRI